MKNKSNILPLQQRAAASRTALTEAQALEVQRWNEYETAQAREKHVLAAWDRGDDTLPTSALTDAQNALQRADSLLKAAKAGVSRAQRNLIADEPDLAQAVVDALGGEVYGLLVLPVCEEPEEHESLPVLYAVQKRPSTADLFNGTISGEVELLLIGPAYTRPLNADDIGRRLNVAKMRLHHQPTSTTDLSGNLRQSIDLGIKIAYAAVPAIKTPPASYRVKDVANVLAHRITERMQSPTARQVGVVIGGSMSNSHAITVPATPGESRLISSTVGQDGIRTTVIRVSATAYSADSRFDAQQVGNVMTRVVTDIKGECLGGLGRVQSATVVSMEPCGANLRGRQVEGEFVFVSRATTT